MNFIMKLLGYYSCTGTKVSSAATNAVSSTHVNVTNHHSGSRSADGHVELRYLVPKPQVPHVGSPGALQRRAETHHRVRANLRQDCRKKETIGSVFVVHVLNAL